MIYNDYPLWYKLPPVKFELIKHTFNREIMFGKPKWSKKAGNTVRMIRIHNVQHLDLWINQLNIMDNLRDVNLYYSLAKYKDGIPMGSLYLKNRDFGNWIEDHWKQMMGYDFLLDIDADDHETLKYAFHSAKNIKKFFDDCKVPYYLRFSGCGFHFLISHQFLPKLSFDPKEDINIYKYCKEIALKLYDKYSELIDTGIYDSRRVTKIPYSISLYEKQNYLCLPFLTHLEFEHFKLDNMKPTFFYGKLKNRGETLFNSDGNLNLLNEKLKIKTELLKSKEFVKEV